VNKLEIYSWVKAEGRQETGDRRQETGGKSFIGLLFRMKRLGELRRESMSEPEYIEKQEFEDQVIKRLQLFLYLVPVVGFFPALWTLYYRRGTKQQDDLSRAVVTLTLGWLLTYVLLGIGAETSDSLSLPLLLTSSLITSGYFLTNIWLMVRLWQRKSVRLPIISRVGDRLP
jgi:heme/copper-type cytochrome/quinol oxidase subunit 3